MIQNPFRYFKTSREVIQLAVMMYVRFPLSFRNVEDPLHERGIDVCHESIRLWVDRFGPLFAGKIRARRAFDFRQHTQWQWQLDEVFVKINGTQHYLWRAVDHEGEVLECFVTKKRDKLAALRFLKKAMKRYGPPRMIVTDKLGSYGAAMREIGNQERQNTEQYANRLRVEWDSPYGWLFLERVTAWYDGESRILMAGEFERRNTSHVWEWKDVTPSESQINIMRHLIDTDEALLRFHGQQRHEDHDFTESEKRSVRDVLEAYEAMSLEVRLAE